MFFLNESGNPIHYMQEGGMWTIVVGMLVVCGVLLVLLRPLHRIWTDRKTKALIDEMGGEAPEPPPRQDRAQGDEDEGEGAKDDGDDQTAKND